MSRQIEWKEFKPKKQNLKKPTKPSKTKQVQKKKSSPKKKQEVVGFYKEDGEVKPITKAPKELEPTVTRYVSKENYSGGYKAQLQVNVEGVKYDIPVRWETEKVDPLVKSEYRTTDGRKAFKKFLGAKKRMVWLDEDGDEVDKTDVQLVQVMPDGSTSPIDVFLKTKEITGKTYNRELMEEFHPHSYVEMWGNDTSSQTELRNLAFRLIKSGKVIAVNKFIKAKGRKAYVGFVRAVTDQEGNFTLEMMVSENRRRRRRWMPAIEAEVGEEGETKVGKTAKIPEVF